MNIPDHKWPVTFFNSFAIIVIRDRVKGLTARFEKKHLEGCNSIRIEWQTFSKDYLCILAYKPGEYFGKKLIFRPRKKKVS